MKFYIVDAFSEKLFGGNPAGVVIIPDGEDFPTDEICIKTAAELRYSETAFIKRLGADKFNIRYFTPAAEVDLCGHATIGSFSALKYGGFIKNGSFLNQTLAGELNIDVSDLGVLMDMAKPAKLGDISDEAALAELYKIMGLDWQEQLEAGLKLMPQIVSTGLPDIMMPVASLEALNDIEPDFPALSKLSEKYEVTGVHAFTTNCSDATFHARNFAPLYDIDEEAATGTSSGALTYYGYLNGLVKAGDSCTFIQGEKMRRPSMIVSSITVKNKSDAKNDTEKCDKQINENYGAKQKAERAMPELIEIRVGGSSVILAEGEINI